MKRFGHTLAWVLGACLIGYSLLFLVQHWQAMASLSLSNSAILVLNIPLLFLNLLASGKLLDTSLKVLGIDMQTSESFGLACLARFANYLSFAQLGFALRMVYLKRQREVQLSDSLSGIALGNLVFYALSAMVIIGALFLVAEEDQVSGIGVNLMLWVSLILATLLACLLIPLLVKRTRLSNSSVLAPYTSLLNKIVSSPGYGVSLTAWATLLLGSFSLMQWVEFTALGYHARFAEVMLVSAFGSLAALINLTPAGLGINEGLLFLAGGLVNVPENVLLASALLRRFIVFLTIALLSAWFAPRLFGSNMKAILTELRKSGRPQAKPGQDD